jgi:hypothetical protein
VKIAAAIAIAAAGFGGGMAYKKFRAYLRKKDKQRDAGRKKPASMPGEQQATSAKGKPSVAKSRKQPRTRKKSATKSKRNRGKGISEMEGKAARAAAKE